MRHGGPVITKFAPTRMTGPSAAPTPRAAPAAPPTFTSSNAPTAELRSRHDILPPQVDADAFRPGWMVRSRALALVENKLISGQEYQTVLWWRRAAEQLGRMPSQKWLARVDGSSRPDDGMTEAVLAAANAFRASVLALGQRRVGLLLAVIIQDRSWHDVGRQLGLSRKTAQLRALEAIRALHLWRIGEPVPPPPREKFRNQPGSW
jgi:hypothetical protein